MGWSPPPARSWPHASLTPALWAPAELHGPHPQQRRHFLRKEPRHSGARAQLQPSSWELSLIPSGRGQAPLSSPGFTVSIRPTLEPCPMPPRRPGLGSGHQLRSNH